MTASHIGVLRFHKKLNSPPLAAVDPAELAETSRERRLADGEIDEPDERSDAVDAVDEVVERVRVIMPRKGYDATDGMDEASEARVAASGEVGTRRLLLVIRPISLTDLDGGGCESPKGSSGPKGKGSMTAPRSSSSVRILALVPLEILLPTLRALPTLGRVYSSVDTSGPLQVGDSWSPVYPPYCVVFLVTAVSLVFLLWRRRWKKKARRMRADKPARDPTEPAMAFFLAAAAATWMTASCAAIILDSAAEIEVEVSEGVDEAVDDGGSKARDVELGLSWSESESDEGGATADTIGAEGSVDWTVEGVRTEVLPKADLGLFNLSKFTNCAASVVTTATGSTTDVVAFLLLVGTVSPG